MLLEENNIDFDSISDREFEELCFDLILKSGFENVLWRKGSSDDGRDIEATMRIQNPLIGPCEEKWYFECKKFKGPVRVEDIYSKLAWADTRKPRHLMFITSSHLSNQCLNWLESNVTKEQKPYLIHVLNGDHLKRILVTYQDIAEKYFGNKYSRLFKEVKKNWLIHSLDPSVETVMELTANIEYQKLPLGDLAFLVYFLSESLFEYEQLAETRNPSFGDVLDHTIAFLKRESLTSESAILQNDTLIDAKLVAHGGELTEVSHLRADLTLSHGKDTVLAKYLLISRPNGEGVEMILEKTSSFNVKIRFLESDSAAFYSDASSILMNKFRNK